THLRLLDRGEIDEDQLAIDRLTDAAEDAVGAVLFEAADEDLRGDQLAAALLDADVDVRRAAGVRHRLDGAEVVLAGRAGGEPTVALEVRVARLAGAVAGVDVHPPGVHLPDLDDRVLDRAPRDVEDLPAKVGDLTDGRRDRVVDDEEVVI